MQGKSLREKWHIIVLAWKLFRVDVKRTKRFQGVGTWEAVKIVWASYDERGRK